MRKEEEIREDIALLKKMREHQRDLYEGRVHGTSLQMRIFAERHYHSLSGIISYAEYVLGEKNDNPWGIVSMLELEREKGK